MITSKKTQQRHFFAVNRRVKPVFFFFKKLQSLSWKLIVSSSNTLRSVAWRDKSSNASVRAWKLMSPQLLAGLNSGWSLFAACLTFLWLMCTFKWYILALSNNQSLNKQRYSTKLLYYHIQNVYNNKYSHWMSTRSLNICTYPWNYFWTFWKSLQNIYNKLI